MAPLNILSVTLNLARPEYVIHANNNNMKKFALSIIIAASGLVTQTASAQVGVNVGFRIGPLVINVHKPIAPAIVYDEFYYLPEVDAYYSVPEQCYYYNDGYNWVNAAYLPGAYRNYDWRSVRRYEVRAQRPYANHDYYRNKYNGSRNNNWNDQYANRGPQRNNDRNDNWSNRGGNDRYDNRAPQRGNSGRRLPDSPFDSNNGGGRGGYSRPNQPNYGNGGYRPDNDRNQQQSRGDWNGRGQNGDNRNQGDNSPQQPGRGNGGRGGNYGQPTNNGGNQGGGNRGNDRGQGSEGGSPGRQHFAGNIPQDLGRRGLK
jgi:hypothetical protein